MSGSSDLENVILHVSALRSGSCAVWGAPHGNEAIKPGKHLKNRSYGTYMSYINWGLANASPGKLVCTSSIDCHAVGTMSANAVDQRGLSCLFLLPAGEGDGDDHDVDEDDKKDETH